MDHIQAVLSNLMTVQPDITAINKKLKGFPGRPHEWLMFWDAFLEAWGSPSLDVAEGGVEHVPQAVAEEVRPGGGEHDGEPGEERDPPGVA